MVLIFQVGSAAVQIALANGLTVIGTAGTMEGVNLVESLGAHKVLNHRIHGYENEIMVMPSFLSFEICLKSLGTLLRGIFTSPLLCTLTYFRILQK